MIISAIIENFSRMIFLGLFFGKELTRTILAISENFRKYLIRTILVLIKKFCKIFYNDDFSCNWKFFEENFSKNENSFKSIFQTPF